MAGRLVLVKRLNTHFRNFQIVMCLHLDVCECSCTCTHLFMCAYIAYMFVRVHTSLHNCERIRCLHGCCVCIHCLHVCVHIHGLHVCVCIYAYVTVCIYIAYMSICSVCTNIAYMTVCVCTYPICLYVCIH